MIPRNASLVLLFMQNGFSIPHRSLSFHLAKQICKALVWLVAKGKLNMMEKIMIIYSLLHDGKRTMAQVV